jgi:ketosteroid isomerase-like protein
MFKVLMYSVLILLLCLSCNYSDDNSSIEKWKAEIVETEKEFAQLVKEKGLQAGFTEYAAEDAVLMRNNRIITGKSAISDYLDESNNPNQNVNLSWIPEFVDVSKSGDIGYTYGPYKYILSDSSDVIREIEGIFHTVWKRQADGSWKYVWD